MRTKALREKRAKIVSDARGLIDKDNPTAEDMAAFDAAMAEADTIKAQIDRIEKADGLAAELGTAIDVHAEARRISRDQAQDDLAREKRIMTGLLRGGLGALSDEDRAVAAKRIGPIENAAGTGTGAAGGYTIAPAFMRELLIAMKAQGGMRQAARTVATETGVDLPWPTMDDRSQVATIIGENAQIAADTDLTFGSQTLGGYTYKSGVLLVSLQLLQDSAFDFDTTIRDAIAGRFVRGQNAHFTTGDGSGKPSGVITGAALGKTGAAGQTTSITYDDLVDLQHSVDPVYRPGAKFMFHDSTLQVLRKLKDGNGRPLWQPGLAGLSGPLPDTLLDTPYVINQDMPAMAAGAKSVLYGNFDNYIIRDVLGMQMMVLRERYADYLQVGYIAFMRSDGKLISAAQPIKYYANAAT